MLVLAAASNATMDALSFRYGKTWFARHPAMEGWWNPAISWRNKWKDGDRSKGEAFPFSSTALVATTDAWHAFKFLMLLCLYLSVLAPFTRLVTLPWWGWVGILIALKIGFGLVFETMFRWLSGEL